MVRGSDMAGIQLRSRSFVDHQPIPARHAKDHDTLCPAGEVTDQGHPRRHRPALTTTEAYSWPLDC
jgi:hypothetical protein